MHGSVLQLLSLSLLSHLCLVFLVHQTGEDNWVVPASHGSAPSYAPRSSRFGSEPSSVEDDVDVWRYAIVSCMPETTTTMRLQSCVSGKHLSQAFCFALFIMSKSFDEMFIVNSKSRSCNSTFTNVHFKPLLAKNI